MTHTFLWHDYETFGKETRTARPAQFAAIRTDADLNEIGEPMEWFCQPAPDFLPEPEACLVTGITPQLCLEQGIPENEFAAHIEQALAEPETIGVGYNTIRYDDEITRFMFWRNLIDPYAREWQNGCSRWDIIDLVRVTHALRPEGIEWPKTEEGRTSFKLTDLTQANGIAHESAHDAVSDVRATIAMARLIKYKQPRLFDFYLKLRKKDAVADEIGLHLSRPKPFLHLSSMYQWQKNYMALVFPLGKHPTNANEVIVWDCAYDPSVLFDLNAQEIQQRMFTRAEDLPEGIERLPIKTIHINKSPVVIGNLKVLHPEAAERCRLDMENALQNAERLSQYLSNHDMGAVWQSVFQRSFDDTPDVDLALYSGFIGGGDRRLLNQLRGLDAQGLARSRPQFTDGRLDELFFRYKARNYPESLSLAEQKRWHSHRYQHLSQISPAYFEQLDQLVEQDEAYADVLADLYDYAYSIMPDAV